MNPKPHATRAQELSTLYRDALEYDVLPFWEKHSPDTVYGGYFTCLDRQGQVYDTDKFIWLQGRQVWIFSMLHNRLHSNPRWIEIASLGVTFLRKYARDAKGNFYFAMTREGKPLVAPYNIFSDCFAAMAFSQYALATGDAEAREIASQTWANIQKRKSNPKGIYSKIIPETRPLKSFALPMIISNLALEMEWMLNPKELETSLNLCVQEVMGPFLDSATGLIFENIAPDGSHPNCFDGRQLNPGHGIEGMWFMMDIAERRNDQALIERCADVIFNILNFGCYQRDGGIFYFLDAKGKPPLQLEWDQKLWWVHVETLVALAKTIRLTQRENIRAKAWEWYDRVHDYTWSHYPDPAYGEWIGYLNRSGQPLLDLKGGKFKGCFHIPRALHLCAQEFARIAQKTSLL